MAIPFLNHLDLRNVAQLQNALLHKTTEASASNVEAKIIYDTGSHSIKYYNGTEWVSLTNDTDNYVTGGSLVGTTLTLTRTGSLSDITVDLSSLDEIVNDNTITIGAGTLLSGGGTFTLNQGSDTTITINHGSVTNTPTTSTASPANGGTFTAIDSITVSTEGHVTGVNTKTVTLPIALDVDVSVSNLETRLGEINSDINIGDGVTGITVTVRDNLVVDGNLTVSGTTTTVNTETINLADNIITLNSNATTTPTENAGIEVERGDSANVTLNWNEGDDDWEFQAADHQSTPAIATYKLPRTYAASIGNGVDTTITVTHYLGTKDIIVQLYDVSSYETVYADVVRATTNSIDITFAAAPATNDIRVLITTAQASTY